MWEIFHGPNIVEMQSALDAEIAALGDPTLAALNLTRLESDASVAALIAACDALPLLGSQRLIIAASWLSQITTAKEHSKKVAEESTAALLRYLPNLPLSTRLIFVESSTLKADHPIVKLARASQPKRERLFALPPDPAQWIAQRANVRGCTIRGEAISLLLLRLPPPNPKSRDYAEEDSRLWLLKIEAELDKLAAFVQHGEIDERDVALLTPAETAANIFKLTDALSVRNAALASRELRNLIAQGEAPALIIGHIARMLRLLLQAKEHSGLSPQAFAQRLSLHPFVAQKTLEQATRFQTEELIEALETLLATDVAVKTGEMDENAALDVLMVALCRIR